MHKHSKFVVVGKLGATYGVKGWLKVQVFTEKAANILDYTPWYVHQADDWHLLTVEASQQHGKGVIVKIAGIETPEAARKLTGNKIAVMRSQLPVLSKDEYYWSDLEGLTVINQRGEVLGKITYILATGTNDVLVVKGAKELAIPYLPGDTVTKIDLDAQEMHVNWEEI